MQTHFALAMNELDADIWFSLYMMISPNISLLGRDHNAKPNQLITEICQKSGRNKSLDQNLPEQTQHLLRMIMKSRRFTMENLLHLVRYRCSPDYVNC